MRIEREKTAGIVPDFDLDAYMKVISRKDQAQYWCFSNQPYDYVSIEQFQENFIALTSGQKLSEELSQSLFMLKGNKDALSFSAATTQARVTIIQGRDPYLLSQTLN
ncbi:hypothetical protein AAC387_Pa12g1156 [Persea americana]